MAYLLDTNVLVQAKNQHYQFSFCPGFWDWLLVENNAAKLFLAHPVIQEIKAGKDQLANWCGANGALCMNAMPKFSAAMTQVATWAGSKSYTAAAVNEFLSVADSQLVAFGIAGGHTIVTHELPSNSAKRIKIPDACKDLGVKFISPFELLKKRGAKLII